MYKRNIGCLQALLIVIGGICITVAIDMGVTHLIIWIVKGLFNYDLSDKFWYIFACLIVIPLIFGRGTSVRDK